MSNYSLGFDIFARDEASPTFDRLGKKVDQTSSIFSRHKGAIIAAAGAAGAAIVAFGKQSVDAYIDADKSQRVLADAYKRFPAIADVSIEAYKDMAAALQNKTKFDGDDINAMQGKLAAYGLTGAQLRELTPLILDYAEKTGKDLPTAAEDAGKAILGQGRALKAIGLDFTDAGTATGNFDQLVGGLRKQVGGFAEQEGKSAEGRMEILKNKFGDLQETIGEKLLPVLERGTEVLMVIIDVASAVGGAVGTIPAPVLAAVAGLTAFHLLKGPLVTMGSAVRSTLGGLREALLYAGQASERAGGGLKGLSAGFRTFTGTGGAVSMLKSGLGGIVSLLGGPWGIALMGATTAVTLFAQAQANAKGDADSLRDSIDKQTGAWTALSREKIAEKLAFDVNPADIAMLEKLGVNMQALNDAVLTGGPAYNDIYQQLINIGVASSTAAGPAEGLRNAMDAQRAAAERARGEFVSTNKLLGDTGTTAATVGPQMSGLATKIDSVGTSAEDAKRKAQDLANALLGITDATVDSDRAQVAYSQALASSKKALEENGKGLSLSTEAGQKNRIVLADLRDKALAMMDANLKNGASVATVGRQMTTSRADFVKLATQMNGGNKAAAEALADKYGLTRDRVNQMSSAMNNVPKKVVSTLTLVGYIDATARQILGATATAASKQRAIMSGRASGGPVKAGQPYLVGEEGPEIIMPNRDGMVMTASETAAMLANRGRSSGVVSSSSSEQPLTVQLVLDGRIVQESLLRLKRTNGGSSLGLD